MPPVAHAGVRPAQVFDLRALGAGGAPEQQRESPLKYQTRAVACFPSGEGFAVCSVEGRCAIEYFDTGAESQARRFAFKCHRGKEEGGDGREVVYPVNALAVHPTHGTFATGGCDGHVCVWDAAAKKRLHQFARLPTSVASVDFSADGALMAVRAGYRAPSGAVCLSEVRAARGQVASSYTYEQGERTAPPDAVLVRQLADAEVRPKAAAAAPAAGA